MPIIKHHCFRLKGMDQIVKRIVLERATWLKIGIALVDCAVRPVTVKPHTGDFAEICAEFAHLPMQEFQVIRPRQPALLTEPIGGGMPVQHCTVKAQFDSASSGAGSG